MIFNLGILNNILKFFPILNVAAFRRRNWGHPNLTFPNSIIIKRSQFLISSSTEITFMLKIVKRIQYLPFKSRNTKVMSLKEDIRSSKGISGPLWQCFGSRLDQDSIRPVDPNPESDSRSGSRRAKPHKKVHVLKCCMFSFDS
jgi:hypothetical protein